MKKQIITFVVFYILTTLLLALTSCGNDNDMIDAIDQTQPSSQSWTEPYHIKGGSVTEVKSFMASQMKDYTLSVITSENSIHLNYSRDKSVAGILYSFSTVDGALYSVIDTEPTNLLPEVLAYLDSHYNAIVTCTADEYMYTTEDYCSIIIVSKVSDTHFNITYSFVSR